VQKPFDCGCCGCRFYSTKEYQEKFDQDEGYGFCEECEKAEAARNELEWEKAEGVLRSALSEENQTRFDALDKELRKAFVLQAIEDKVMTFEIRGAKSWKTT
jgi:hypothetical protein